MGKHTGLPLHKIKKQKNDDGASVFVPAISQSSRLLLHDFAE
jgi:hypothetical protein